MSTIRRQSIISSVIVYSGFVLGFINTYFFTKKSGAFTPAEYGLTVIFVSIGTIMFSVANLGMSASIYKFFPYYEDHLPRKQNDMMTWAMLICSLGFAMVIAAGLVFKNLVIRKFGSNSAELVHYYVWIFPFGFGFTFYSLLESYAWQLKRSVLTNFLKEIQFRLFTLLLIGGMYLGLIRSFDLFIRIYAFAYILTALILLVYLMGTGKLHFTFRISKVTRRMRLKIRSLALLVWTGGMLYNISFYFAQIVIAAVVPGGLTDVGIFTLAQYIASIIQAPQRGIIAASIAPLSRAWKEKDYQKINRIYHRSSINQLIFSMGVFILIWVNFTDGVITFHLKNDYFAARYIFLFIGLTRIVDMGTGVNSQIIATSTFWRFDFFTGMILTGLTLPMNYILAKKLGMVGPAIADLITFTVYNGLRYLFLYRKFGMQPFTIRTLYTLLLGLAGYAVCHFLLLGWHGYPGMFLRSTIFLGIYGGGVLALRISDDVLPVWQTIRKRLGLVR